MEAFNGAWLMYSCHSSQRIKGCFPFLSHYQIQVDKSNSPMVLGHRLCGLKPLAPLQEMVRLQTIFKSNDGSVVTVLDPMTVITCIFRHSLECIGNCLYFRLHLQAKLDSYVRKNEEAEERKACTPEAHDNVAIDRQREDSDSSEMGFPFFREMKKTRHWEQ
jgi:hypothetical protein